MVRRIYVFSGIFLALGCAFFLKARKPSISDTDLVLRIGYFANLTHVHALLFQAMDRQDRSGLEKYLPPNVKIEWYRFNAGPSAMESLVTGNIDISFVGPSPAINLYMRTQGKDVRLLSGAVRGGSGLVFSATSDVFTANAVWEHKKIATPQYGNTQDIACRAWFDKHHIHHVYMSPVTNADQLLLFKKQQIDGVWTIEPWLSHILSEGGRLFYEDKDNWTTLLVGSKTFCRKYPALKGKIVQAQHDLTAWIKSHTPEAIQLCVRELKHQTNIDFPYDGISQAFQRLKLADEVKASELQSWIDDAVRIQFLPQGLLVSLDDFFSETLPGARSYTGMPSTE